MLKITEVRNAKYTNADGWINCEIRHDELEGGSWIPYHINPKEDHPFIDMATLASSANKTNPTAYTAPTQKELDAETAKQVRMARDQKLFSEVDPIVTNPLRWDTMSSEDQTKVKNYRTSLLDVTKQSGFPNSVTWPEKDF